MQEGDDATILLSSWLRTDLKGLSTLTIKLVATMWVSGLGKWRLDEVMSENKGMRLSELYLWLSYMGHGSSPFNIDDTGAIESDLRRLVLGTVNEDNLTEDATKDFMKGYQEDGSID